LTLKEGVFSSWKGQRARVVLAGFLELHAPVDDVDDVDAIEQVIDEGLGYAAGHGMALRGCLSDRKSGSMPRVGCAPLADSPRS
jgi:hypothetical protein